MYLLVHTFDLNKDRFIGIFIHYNRGVVGHVHTLILKDDNFTIIRIKRDIVTRNMYELGPRANRINLN